MNSAAIVHIKAGPLNLRADTASEEAFIAIIGACLPHADANLPAVLDGQIDGVYQMRVALRLLRSGLRIFRPLIPREASAELVEDIRWLNGFLGPARDRDVFLHAGMAAIFDHFPCKRGLILFRIKAETLRQTHHRTLREALAEPRYPSLLQRFADWLDRRAWRECWLQQGSERNDFWSLCCVAGLAETRQAEQAVPSASQRASASRSIRQA